MDYEPLFRCHIAGMHCAGCVARIESALGKLPGVTDVAVNLATNEARLRIADGTTADVLTVIEALGYRATPADPDDLSAG